MKVGDRVQIIASRVVAKIADTDHATSGPGVCSRYKVAGHWYYPHELKRK